jgi:hypothetical protein
MRLEVLGNLHTIYNFAGEVEAYEFETPVLTGRTEQIQRRRGRGFCGLIIFPSGRRILRNVWIMRCKRFCEFGS